MRARCRGFAPLALIVFLGAHAALAEDRDPDFTAVARAGARPRECGGAARETPTRWDRAKVPALGPYCAALARGYASLRTLPRGALDAAALAERLLPGRAAPSILSGRARVALGEFAGAWDAFEHARALSRKEMEVPGALHDLAIAALRTGHQEAALDAYVALAPRAALLDDPREEVRVLVEVGVLSMSLGPEHLSEAIAFLTEARRRAKSFGASDFVQGALSLADSRDGRLAEAAAVAEEASGPWRLEAEREGTRTALADRPELPEGELDAIIAALAEGRDRELALSRWQSYLESRAGKSSPFAAHARARRDAMRGHKSGAAR